MKKDVLNEIKKLLYYAQDSMLEASSLIHWFDEVGLMDEMLKKLEDMVRKLDEILE